jgi:hypothetical protein
MVCFCDCRWSPLLAAAANRRPLLVVPAVGGGLLASDCARVLPAALCVAGARCWGCESLLRHCWAPAARQADLSQ